MTSAQSPSLPFLPRALACGILLASLVPHAALAQPTAPVTFAIPAQALPDALAEFTRQSGAQVVLAPGVRAGSFTSDALDATLPPADALAQLLESSGLDAQRNANGDFIIATRTYAPDIVRRGNVETLVVTGQQIDRLLSDVDIGKRQANDLDDLFSGYSSVMVGGSVGAAQKIYVRNLGEDMLNISVDGAQQTGVTYHHTGRITVEPELLKQVEVQVGAGEATNGPGALGGAVRFVTKDPNDMLGAGRNFGGMVKTGYFSNTRGEKTSIAAYGRFDDTFSAMVNLVRADHEAIEDGNGTRLGGTDSNQELGFAKFVAEPTADQRFALSFEQLDEDGFKSRRPEWVGGPGNPEWFLEFSRRTITANHEWTPFVNDLINLETTVYDTEFSLYRPIDTYTSMVATQGFALRNTSRFERHELIYGVDYRDDEITAGDVTRPSEEKETTSVLGFYVQDHFQLTDGFMLSLGTRYDQFELTDDDATDFDENGFSPNAGFAWSPSDALTFSGSVARVVRGPESNDGFKLFGTTNDPNLKAERARNIEFGVEYEMGAFTYSAGVHDLTVADAIGNPLPWSRHYQNLGDLESDGYSLGVAYTGDRVQANVSLLDTDGEINGEELTRYAYGYLGTSAGTSVAINAAWTVSPQLEIGWIGQLVRGIDDLYISAADATIDKPGYSVHDFYAQWQPRDFDMFSLTMTVKNAFDRQYLDHGSIENLQVIDPVEWAGVVGSPAQGRDLRVTAALRF